MRPKIALLTPKPESHRTAEETLALGYLASALRQAGHYVVIIDGWLRKLSSEDIVKELARDKPPLIIGFSCYRSNLEQAKKILQLAKQQFGKIYSICGGYGPTFHDSDFLNAGFDVVVRGEAEHIIVPLVHALINEKSLIVVPGISFWQGSTVVRTKKSYPSTDLDALAFPTRDEIIHAINKKNPVHICTSRGCLGNCIFCSIAAFAKDAPGKRWRCRSLKNIVDELRYLSNTFSIKHFKFVDDSFIEPPRDEQWAKTFANMTEKLNIKFRTQVRADRLTPLIVKNLKRAGWFATSIGIESGSPGALRRMGKSASLEDNLRALSWLRENKIYVQMGMILFDNATTLKELEENYCFLKEHDWVVTKGIFTEMYAAEGTPFSRQLSKQGLLRIDEVYQNYQYSIQDTDARRIYHILKKWHRSHARLYDCVIDPISAPKVLPLDGYEATYLLCRKLLNSDLNFFQKAINLVRTTSNSKNDKEFLVGSISRTALFYKKIKQDIAKIYNYYGLTYDGALNPFLQ